MNTTTATPSHAPAIATPARSLHIGLWVAQGLLGLAFLGAGAMKLTTPLAELTEAMPWMEGSLAFLVRFIGAAEIAGAVGVIVPALTRIRPQLTALAALGLSTVMGLALATHLTHGEFEAIPAPLLLGALALFVAWGRGRKAPILAR